LLVGRLNSPAPAAWRLRIARVPLLKALLEEPARLSRAASPTLIGLGLAAVLWPVIQYHPYEVAYFNSFIGGLGGAQTYGLFGMPPPTSGKVRGTEGDYWFSSMRDALEDLRGIAKSGDTVSACGGPYFHRVNSEENPLPVRFVDWWEAEYHTGQYMLLMPRETTCWWREIREFEAERPVVKRVTRGGGLIYEILGPKTGEKYTPVSPETWYEKNPIPSDGVAMRLVEAQKVANGRPVVKRVAPGGIIVYDVIDPATGQVVWAQPVPSH